MDTCMPCIQHRRNRQEETSEGSSRITLVVDESMAMGDQTTSRDRSSVGEGDGANTPPSLSPMHQTYLALARVVLAEMIGTFILVFSTCGIVACTKIMRMESGLLEYALTGGFAITTIVFSVGHISGAHVNPSITIAFAAAGRFPWSKVPFYVMAQILASVLATWMGKLVYNMPMDIAVTRPILGSAEAFFAELIATLFIVFLASALATSAENVSQSCGLVIGSTISLAVLITGPVSGGSMNPARSLGPAIISGDFSYIWIYIIAPSIGATIGALLFKIIQNLDKQSSSIVSSASI